MITIMLRVLNVFRNKLKEASLPDPPRQGVDPGKSFLDIGVILDALRLPPEEFNFVLDMLDAGLALLRRPFEMTDLLLKPSGVVSPE